MIYCMLNADTGDALLYLRLATVDSSMPYNLQHIIYLLCIIYTDSILCTLNKFECMQVYGMSDDHSIIWPLYIYINYIYENIVYVYVCNTKMYADRMIDI